MLMFSLSLVWILVLTLIMYTLGILLFLFTFSSLARVSILVSLFLTYVLYLYDCLILFLCLRSKKKYEDVVGRLETLRNRLGISFLLMEVTCYHEKQERESRIKIITHKATRIFKFNRVFDEGESDVSSELNGAPVALVCGVDFRVGFADIYTSEAYYRESAAFLRANDRDDRQEYHVYVEVRGVNRRKWHRAGFTMYTNEQADVLVFNPYFFLLISALGFSLFYRLYLSSRLVSVNYLFSKTVLRRRK
mmetsp:Transcript_18186/g.22329  ORF Transcript_18186/g.22329 Transcript_18186/m.22329 type:complete len:249 (+) Transcript_18186:614-1360(+)